MKTGTEYMKRKHRITQDEDKQTKEIELRKLRKSKSKSSNTDMNNIQHSNEEMEELRNRTSKLGEDNDLVDQFQLLSQLYVWLERLSI